MNYSNIDFMSIVDGEEGTENYYRLLRIKEYL